MLSEAVEALFDCGFGNGERIGDVAEGEVVEAEVEECPFVGFEFGDKAKIVGWCLVDFLGDGVVHPIVERYESGLSCMSAYLGYGDVEGYAMHPGVGTTFVSEIGPGFPQSADDFLVEVADIVWLAVGEMDADLEKGTLAAVEHFKELAVDIVINHTNTQQGKQGMPRFIVVIWFITACHIWFSRVWTDGDGCLALGKL